MAEVQDKPVSMKERIGAMSRKEKEARLKAVKAEMATASTALGKLMAEDRTPFAQEIIDKMFGEFKDGAKWVKRMQKLATEDYYVYSTLGRRRFLPAAMIGDQAIVSQQVRRGMNAPIQGMASEIGVKAGRCILESYYKHLPRIMKLLGKKSTIWKMRVFFARMVHDANYLAVPYEMVLVLMHIMQWEATYGVTERYKKEFGLTFTVEPEIEMEIAAIDSGSHKMNWRVDEMIDTLRLAVVDAEKLGLLESKKKEPEARINDVMRKVIQPWRDQTTRDYLQKHFPLLGVKDLDWHINKALKKYDAKHSSE